MDKREQKDRNFSDELATLEAELASIIRNAKLPAELSDAVNYSVFPGGKRIRPRLSFALALDLGVSLQSVFSPAAAIELIHCASLVHDDMPALDNDDERRGQPSCHKKFGEAVALLVGDALVSVAIEAAMTGGSKCGASVARANTELVAGQYLDISRLKHSTFDELRLFQLKTGALFGASCEIAAILSNQSEVAINHAREFGVAFGVLFQIIDDINDSGSDCAAKQLFSHAREDLYRKFSILVGDTSALPRVESFVGELLDLLPKELASH